MTALTSEIFKLLLGTLIGVYAAVSIIPPKSKIGLIAYIVISVFVTLLGMKYYADNGRHYDETAACTIFSTGKACIKPKPIATNTAKPVGPPRLSLPPKPLAVPNPAPAIEMPKISARADGWWPVGTPSSENIFKGSPDILWEWANRNVGACQPFRDFAKMYPNDPRTAKAIEILSRLRVKDEPQKTITADRIGPLAYSYSNYENMNDGKVCSIMRNAIQSGNNINMSFASNNGFSDCSTITSSEGIFGEKSILLSFRNEETKACECHDTWFEGRKCTIESVKVCQISRTRSQKIESCKQS